MRKELYDDYLPPTEDTEDVPIEIIQMPRIQPRQLSRTELTSRTLAIEEIRSDIIEECADNESLSVAFGAVVDTKDLGDLLDLNEHKSHALMLYFDDAFEPYLFDLIQSGPDAINATTIDKLENDSVYRWRLEMKNGIKASFWAHSPVFYELTKGYHMNSDEDCRSIPPTHWVPIVFVAGNTVVVGGFWCDDLWEISGSSAGNGAGINYRPYRLWPDEEINRGTEKAKLTGNRPWENHWWLEESGLAIAPPIFDLRT